MGDELRGRRVAFVVSNEGVEQAELTSPWDAVKAAGGEPVLIAPKEGKVQCFKHLDKSDSFDVDETSSNVNVDNFDALVLPGGVASADQLRLDRPTIAFVGSFFDTGRPVAVICHGPWSIIEADRVRGRTLTSWPSLQTDVQHAGGTWVDAEVQVCDAETSILISSRKPDDLPVFNAKLLEVFASASSVAL